MKIGLQIPSFTWPGGPEAIGRTLARIARDADDVGFDSIWVMDHFIQIRSVGRPEEPMLEGWTTLGFLAAATRKARLGLLVGGVHYRAPGLWIKAATTLDVLSGGRAWLGIGAAWNEAESRALGFPFPPLGARFELLEDTLRLAHEMWAGERGSEESLVGHQLRAERPLNSPQSLSRPRVPIMIGGGGEQKTLRLVARYADATNVFGTPEGIAHKFQVLRAHCAEVARDYDEIERTTLQPVRLESRNGRVTAGSTSTDTRRKAESAGGIVERIGELGDAGAQHVILSVADIDDPDTMDRLARDIVPHVHALP